MKMIKLALPVLALALTTGLAGTAQAATVTCVDAGIVPSGFTVMIHETRVSAQLNQHTIEGVQILSEDVPCVRQDIDPLTTRAGDVVLKCRKENSVDNGLVLSVRSPNEDGFITATLTRATIAGQTLVAEMRCTSTPEVAAEDDEVVID